jgi:hypothetical protein
MISIIKIEKAKSVDDLKAISGAIFMTPPFLILTWYLLE